MKPSPALLKRSRSRLPYTTKEVGSGYYKGTGTGSLGAHTKYGGYLIDYRKTRAYVPPEGFTRNGLKGFHLTPFVSAEIELPDKKKRIAASMRDGLDFLRYWREASPAEYDERVEFEQERRRERELLQQGKRRQTGLQSEAQSEEQSSPEQTESQDELKEEREQQRQVEREQKSQKTRARREKQSRQTQDQTALQEEGHVVQRKKKVHRIISGGEKKARTKMTIPQTD